MIFDSHAHYDDERFDSDRSVLLSGMRDAGVEGIINIGCNLKSARRAVALAEEYDFIYAVVGVHPEDAHEVDEAGLNTLEALYRHEKVKAIGEIGLDYHYEPEKKLLQQEAFKKQLALAKRLDAPVVIHDREAHQDVLDIIKESGVRKGVFHAFSGSAEMAKEVLGLGFYISVGGVLTFKNAKKLPEIMKTVPLDRILLETDCPYLAPEPFRGQRNDSSMILYTARKLAELLETDVDMVIDETTKNTKALFGI